MLNSYENAKINYFYSVHLKHSLLLKAIKLLNTLLILVKILIKQLKTITHHNNLN